MGHARSEAVCSTGWDQKQPNFFVGVSSCWREAPQGRQVRVARNAASAAAATYQFSISASNSAMIDGSLIEQRATVFR